MNGDGLRAQSETVGVVLLVGVVIIAVSGIGIAYLGDIDTDDGPRANLEAQVETGSLTLVHQGGASLPGDELRLLLRVNGSERPFAWDDSYLDPADGSLDPGDEWRNASASFAPRAEVELRVIHRPSNTVILETLVNPTVTPTATPVPTVTPSTPTVTPSTPTGTPSSPTPTGTPSTPTDAPSTPTDTTSPSVERFEFSDEEINDSEANANVQRTVTVTFDEGMDQTRDPTVFVTGIGTSSAVVLDGSWIDGRTYEAVVEFYDNDVDRGFGFGVQNAYDTAGNELPGTATTGTSYVIDTVVPGTPNSVSIRPNYINVSTVEDVAVDVANPDTVVGDERVFVTLSGPNGGFLRKDVPIDTSGDGETTVLFDTASLDDGDFVTTSVSLTDDVGNVGDGLLDKDPTTKDTIPPAVTRVTIPDAPVTDADVASGTQTVTVEFSEQMDTAAPPTVTIEGLDRSYLASQSNNNLGSLPGTWSGTVDVQDDDEDATATVAVTGAEDAAGNVMAPDDSATFEVDTDEPSISSFGATNPRGTRVQVEFESDQRLSSIEVPIRDDDGNLETTLVQGDFTESGSGPYTYTAIWNAKDRDTFEATLAVATDDVGNDGAADQSMTVTIQPGGRAFEDINGNRQFDPGTDVPIPDPEIKDGTYDAGSNGLVIPSEVGAIRADGISLDGQYVVSEVDLAATASDGSVRLSATEDVDIEEVSVETSGYGTTATVTAGTNVSAAGTDFSGVSGTVSVSGTDGYVDVTGGSFDATSTYGAAVELTASGQVSASTTSITAAGLVNVSGGEGVDATDAQIEQTNGGEPTSLVSGAGSVDVSTADVDAAGATTIRAGETATADDGTVTSGKDLSVSGRDVSAIGATIEATGYGNTVSVTGDRSVDVSDAAVSATGRLEVTTAGIVTDVAARNAELTVDANSYEMVVESAGFGATTDVRGATITSKSPVTVSSGAFVGGNVVADQAVVDTTGQYGGSVDLSGTGGVSAVESEIRTQGETTVESSRDAIDLSDASIDTSGGYGMRIELSADGDASLGGTTLRVDGNANKNDPLMRVTVGDDRVVDVSDARFENVQQGQSMGTLYVLPDRSVARGEPQKGKVKNG